jgi:enterochelin esterase-like enzyme
MTSQGSFEMSRRALLTAAGVGAAALTLGQAAPAQANEGGAGRGTSPTVHPDRRVTFTLREPAASTVTVNGVWGRSFTPISEPMVRDRHGVWSLTVGPLAPSFYTYSFTVDGVATKDPANHSVVHSTPALSTFLLSGPGTAFITRPPVPRGRLSTLAYHSAVTGTDRLATVWTPPGYSTRRDRYPTFYLYHGGGGDYLDWVQQGRADIILDNLFAARRLRPMVVVMPDGNVPGATARPEVDSLPPELVENVVPAVERAYHVSRSSRDRALAGLSLGGLQTWNTLLTHPGFFADIGDFSSGWFPDVLGALRADDAHLLRDPAVNGRTRQHRIYIGNTDDIAFTNNVATRALFDDFGIRYGFSQFAPAGHAWETWRHNLADFAPRLRF